MFEMKNLLIRKVGGSMLLEAQKKKVKRQAFLALSSVLHNGEHGAHISAYLEVGSWCLCGSYPRRKSYKNIQNTIVTCWYFFDLLWGASMAFLTFPRDGEIIQGL